MTQTDEELTRIEHHPLKQAVVPELMETQAGLRALLREIEEIGEGHFQEAKRSVMAELARMEYPGREERSAWEEKEKAEELLN